MAIWTANQRRDVEERMHALSDHDLLRLLALEAHDYTPDALEIARHEIRLRNLEVLDTEEYWTKFPAERVGEDGFCARCRDQTTDESPGSTGVSFLLGIRRLIGHDDICSACGSVLQTKWFQFILPIIPLARYRVLYLDSGFFSSQYIGRKIRG